jgi:hypothetical protein
VHHNPLNLAIIMSTPELTIFSNTVQSILCQIPDSFTDPNLTSPHIRILIKLLGRDPHNFVPRAQLEYPEHLLFTRISRTSSWATAGANVVHSLSHSLADLFVPMDCPHAQLDDAYPHFTNACQDILISIYDKYFNDLESDNDGVFLLSIIRNAGVFRYLTRMYRFNCSSIIPAYVLSVALSGMVRSKKLFDPGNWVICKAFLDDVRRVI